MVDPTSLDALLAPVDAEPARDVDRRMVAVQDVRRRGEANMPGSTAQPSIEVDPDTFPVRVGGRVWESRLATSLPVAQCYMMC